MSDVTKKYRFLSRLFFWLGVILLFLPLIIFGISGCINGAIDIDNKITFGLCFVASMLLTVLAVKSKYNCRSMAYILLFGCYFIVKRIEIVVLISGICAILDDFVCNPLHKYYRQKAVINKEIDKRYDVQQREKQEN